MREIVHIQAGQCGNQIGAKVSFSKSIFNSHFPFTESTVAKMASFLHDFSLSMWQKFVLRPAFSHAHICIYVYQDVYVCRCVYMCVVVESRHLCLYIMYICPISKRCLPFVVSLCYLGSKI